MQFIREAVYRIKTVSRNIQFMEKEAVKRKIYAVYRN